jgi:predicted metal-dependent hydrolase
MRSAIVRRRVDFDLDAASVPRAWFAGDVHISTFFGALSLLFPEGERFFVESVRAMSADVADPELRAAIAGFIGQEAMHGKEHRAFNDVTRAHVGDVVDRLEAGLRKLLVVVRRTTPRRAQLAVTCALEHFTAIMAEHLLGDERDQRRIHERVRLLWVWHALEESEHKAVAFDVYRTTGGGYLLRVAVMAVTTLVFFAELFHVHARLLARQGEAWNLRGWLGLARHLWIAPGMFRRLAPAYLDYYRPGFHPDDRDTRHLLDAWKERLFADGGELQARLRSATVAEA